MNKKIFLILLLSLFVFSCFSQERYSKYMKKLIKDTEKSKYSGEHKYPLFEEDITLINDSIIQYDDKIVRLFDVHNDYKPIFYSGLFYPVYELEDSRFETPCIS
jgi:hypothetical protein